jgi:hypothetical protein
MSKDKGKGKVESEPRGKMSRRTFLGGVALGAAGAWGLSHGLARFGYDPAKLLATETHKPLKTHRLVTAQ